MREHFCIWIVSPEGLVWSHVFDEVALGLQSAFRDLGYAAPIVTDPKEISGTPLVLGANLCPMYKIPVPENAILYNLEQVHAGSRWFQPDYGYVELLKRHAVWDFSARNIAALSALGVGPVVHCPVGYAPELTRIGAAKQDVDVLFIGGGHPRRQKVLEDISRKGVRLHTVYKVFGKERDDWMRRGKIHLNMHKEPAELFEIVRVSYLLSNRCFVVSERGQDAALEAPLEGGLVFAPYDKLAETCLHYLMQPKERKRIAEAGFELFRKMPQREFLDAALFAYEREQRRKTLNPAKKSPRIFVAMASFRDPEAQATLSDLFRRAAHPERIRAGVCLQNAPEDADCEVDESRFDGKVKVLRVDAAKTHGANWARAQALSFRRDEEYVLLIDSHMRFVDGWDAMALEMLARCPADKPVLTSYLPNYDPPNHRFHHPKEMLRVKVKGLGRPGQAQVVHISGELVMDVDMERGGLYPTPFPVANFIFAPSAMLDDVPIDPHIHFWGDEVTLAARLWTHGYDIFQADAVLGYHYWVRKDRFHLQDYREPKHEKNRESAHRVRWLLGLGRKKQDVGPYGLGDVRSLEDFWQFAGIDWENIAISANAQEGIWDMAAREKGRKDSAKKPAVKRPRIFVQIASYRDPECQWTVKDLFEKAAHPERVFVGICWQFVPGEDDICFTEPYPRPAQVRVHEVNAHDSKGVCWARGLTQKLWQGEEYTLQIDSHMRFEPGWDETLLSMFKDCEDERAVLTCYPPGYTPPDQLERDWIFGMSAKEFDKHGIFLMKGAPNYSVRGALPDRPMPGAFLSANMLFGPASIIQDVPYDPYLYFFGEEITLAARLWTHGYNLFHPNRPVVYHDWNRNKRPTHFSDHQDWGVSNDKSFARVKHMLGTAHCPNPELTRELDVYGLGSARSLKDYEQYAGIDFAQKTISEKAYKGDYERYGTARKLTTIRLDEGAMSDCTAKKDGRIFVNIASYRDPECQWTVKDLFEKAANPDRIFVGICWQFDEEEDKHCFEVSTRPEQVRIFPVDWREAEGVCWARYQAQQLWEGEEYTLMIDSHMRFVPGWDEMMLEELAKCDAPKPLISMSPVGYLPPNRLGKRMNPTIRRAKPFQPDGNIRCQGEMLDRVPEKPLHGAFLVANFIFSRSEVITEVPYDPYLYFDQEEISYAARLYTHGWDIFHPTRQMCYHYYNDVAAPGGSVRPLHWRDLHKEDNARIRHLRERGLKRFNHMTGYQHSDDAEVTQELDTYGFGRERSLAQYERFSGVDFKHKIATDRALYCLFIEELPRLRDRPIIIPELEGKKAPPVPPAAKMAVAGGASAAVARQPQFMPVQQQPVSAPRVAAAAAKFLEQGDFMPMFETHDTEKKLRTIENMAGRYGLVLYLPSARPDAASGLCQELQERLGKAGLKDKIWQLLVTDDTLERANAFREKFGISQQVCLDAERRIARSLGIARQGEGVPFAAFILDTNLKIMHAHRQPEPGPLAALLANELALEMARYHDANAQPKIIRHMAPALIVPEVFTPEFCAKCIRAFRTGRTFEGTVGAREKKMYRADIKIRTDHIVHGELLEEIDDKFSRSFFPEIKKVFGFEVTHREVYKIGLYTGEKGGFFKQHRDNFDYPMGYRRVASTIHLNDDYDGGGVRFPEYGQDVYRPPAGGAIAFSAATMHEALPVTKGERFVLVAFLHGEQDEAYRHYFNLSKNEPVKEEEYRPRLRQFPELRQSRWFYKDWQDKYVRYDGASAPVIAQPPAFPAAANVNQPEAKGPAPVSAPAIIAGNHRPTKIFESRGGIVYDNFLPEDVYQKLYSWAQTADYEYINTHGKVTRAWHVHDGFPLRSCKNFFYHAKFTEPQKPEHVYPMKNEVDAFMEAVLAIQPQVEHLVGKRDEQWAHFSVTSWLYPHGTGLAMHDDGSGVYTGAYTFFMNPTWRAHWGGMLLLMDEDANRNIHDFRNRNDQMAFYKQKFLHAGKLDELLLETGMAKCIFPKGNRIVFIANDAYHMVTRVNEQAGDHLRMSLAGFFNRKK